MHCNSTLKFRTSGFVRALLTALFAMLAGATPALAQVQSVTPPVFRWIDELGVDASTGEFNIATTEVVIGQPGAGGLGHGRSWIGAGWRDDLAGTISSSGSVYTVSLGGISETFDYSGGVFTSKQRVGSSLTLASGKYSYTPADGSVVEFDTSAAGCSGVTAFWACNQGTITKLVKPDGEVITWTYKTASVGGQTARRPQSVSNNLGYQIHFTYADDSPANTTELLGPWLQRTKATGINRAYYYCADNANTCSHSTGGNWPYVTYGSEAGGIQTVTDRLSQTTRYVIAGGVMTGVRTPTSSTSNRAQITYTSGKVSNVSSTLGGTFSNTAYTYNDASGVRTTTIAPDIEGGPSIVKTDLTTGWVTEIWGDGTGTRKTVLTRDSYGRVTRTTRANGDYTNLIYDARGNVTQTTEAPKTGSGLLTISTSATYPASCSNPKTCNKPTTTTDAKGQVTNYTYNSTHGGVTKATLPAPGSGPYSSVRPETRFTYASLSAWYKNSGGSLVQAPSAVYRLTETSACAIGSVSSGCVGTANETRAIAAYQAGSSSVPSNVLPATATARSGNTSGTGAVSSSVTTTYTVQSDIATIDGPLGGTSDTAYLYYDDMRRPRASVSPDPDGGGSLQRRVVKATYNADGLPTVVQAGYVSAPSSWNSLTVMQQQDHTYNNALGMLTKTALSSGGTTYSVVQFGIGEFFSRCTAIRMNPNEFASLPADGCSLDTQGAYGPDRITLTGYTSYSQLDGVTSGYHVANRSEGATDYDDSTGVLESLTDAASNKTSYQYDDFFRLKKTIYPSPSTPGQSNSNDYEELTYNSVGEVTGRRGRDGNSFAFSYDNLDRMTLVDAPGGEPDISYTYDNFGRILTASQPTRSVTYTYDALGGIQSETQFQSRTVTYEYDAAGRRTKMTWPDGFYVNYDYNTVGEMTAIRENGATSGAGVLATFAYDNLGRRTYLTRGTSSYSYYEYDGASRLSWLLLNLSGSAYDYSMYFSYNPAGQIVGGLQYNASYNFSSPSPYTDSYTSNGLNQYTNAASVTPTYDSRGNMTYDGTKSYDYDYSSRLNSAGSAGLSYDSSDRLIQLQVSGGTTTQFLYDGADVIAEYVSGSVVRRYVHGPGIDEPLVQYDGSGTSVRKHLHADERGSIVAVEGSSTTVSTYDEYGVPGSGNVGRFQYTGQMWLSEIGLYHYKARAYNPELGRFMQTDLIGYGDGMNLYNYVHSDPVNSVDPLGLTEGDFVTVTGPTWWQSLLTPSSRADWPANGNLVASPSGGAPRFSELSEMDEDALAGDFDDRVVVTGKQTQRSGQLFSVDHKKGVRESTRSKHERGEARHDREQAKAAERAQREKSRAQNKKDMRGQKKKPPMINKGPKIKNGLWFMPPQLLDFYNWQAGHDALCRYNPNMDEETREYCSQV